MPLACLSDTCSAYAPFSQNLSSLSVGYYAIELISFSLVSCGPIAMSKKVMTVNG